MALMVLVVLDGVPGLELSGYATRSARARDVALVALAVALLLWRFPHEDTQRGQALRRLSVFWSVLLAIWFSVTFIRTLAAGIPFTGALFSRQYLFFAILLPLAVRARFTRREVTWFLATLLGATLLYSLANVITALGLANASAITHGATAVDPSGIVRVYSPMADLVAAFLCFSLAALFMGRDRQVRGWAAVVFVITATSFTVELGRAYYIGIVTGIFLMTAWWLTRRAKRAFQFRLAVTGATAACLVVSLLLIAPSVANRAVVSGVGGRVTASVTDVFSSTGTVGYRYHVINAMEQVLGNQWPDGLGFLNPTYRYFPELPSGSLTNADVGVFNALMTMGVIGALLVYLPMVYILVLLMRDRTQDARVQWIEYGGAIWIVTVLASSLTLIILFNSTGLVLTVTVLAALCHILARRPPMRQSTSASRPRLQRPLPREAGPSVSEQLTGPLRAPYSGRRSD